MELPPGKVIYAADHDIRLLRVSPKGDRFAIFQRDDTGTNALVTVDLAGKAATLVAKGIRGQGLAWSPSGGEIWFDDRGERGQFLLKAVDVAGRVRVLTSAPVGMIIHDVSRDGRILVERYGSQPGILGLFPGETVERDLSWFDESQLAGLSDDGRAILINEVGDSAGQAGAHYLRLTDGSPAIRLGDGKAGSLSPDGKWVTLPSPGARNAFVMQPTGTGSPITIEEPLFQEVGGGGVLPRRKARSPSGRRAREGAPAVRSGASQGPAAGDHRSRLWNRPRRRLPRRPLGRCVRRVVRGPLPPADRRRPGAHDPEHEAARPDSLGVGRKVSLRRGLRQHPAEILRVDVATGRREPVRTLAPPERAGIIEIGPVFMTPDGKSYAYGYSRAATSDLYVIDGIR